MQGRTQMQQLMHILDEKKYVEFHKKDENTDEIMDIFFGHPYSMTLVKCFPHVLIMDCTYKTNRHGLPLLEIVGVMLTEKTFIVAHAYFHKEMESNYRWALECLRDILLPGNPTVIVTDCDMALMNAIKIIFPDTSHMLCTFHISRNVEQHGKENFTTKKSWDLFIQDFHNMIKSYTKEEYNENVDKFRKKCEKYKDLLSYIDRIWLKYKEIFVAAWTNKSLHFSNVTTNRVESQHASLKRYLCSSRGDLINNLNIIDNLLISQYVTIRVSFRKSLRSNLQVHQISYFNNLRGFVSSNALELTNDERKKNEHVGVDISRCGCVIRTAYGLPCAHEILQFRSEGRGIPLFFIHQRWMKLNDIPGEIPRYAINPEQEISFFRMKFDQATNEQKIKLLNVIREATNPASTNMVPPAMNKFPKGKPIKKKRKISRTKDDSIKRDPSGFEYAKTLKEQTTAVFAGLQNLSKGKKGKRMRKNEANNKKEKTILLDLNENQYVSSVFELFYQTIKEHVLEGFEDVPADGHCGYRCYAELLDLDVHNGWRVVRRNMLIELSESQELYTGILGGEEGYKKVSEALNYFEVHNVRVKYWMQLPDMGCLFASAFNCIFCVFSPGQSLTYLPLRTGPTNPVRIVPIVLYDDIHFMKVILKEGSLLSHVIPDWRKQQYPDAEQWVEVVQMRINEWRNLIGDPLAANPSSFEIINVL